MRGKGDRKDDLMKIARITPAYAGKSFSSAFDAVTLADHPRLCGEK